MNWPCIEQTHIDRLKKALRPSEDQAYELTLYRPFEEGLAALTLLQDQTYELIYELTLYRPLEGGLAALTGPSLWTDLV